MKEGRGEVKKSLRASIKDGAFYAIMVGFGESYLAPYAVHLGASNPQIALLSSLPQLLGAFCQFISVRVIHAFQRRKAAILAGVSLQASMWVPIIVLPLLFPRYAIDLLIGLVVLYFIGLNFANPAWTSLMGDLVYPHRRGRFFGQRNRLISISAFAALCLGGVILHQASQRGWERAGFVGIFALAFGARWISVSYLSQHIDPPYSPKAEDSFSVWEFLSKRRNSNFGRFVLYVALMHFSVMVSAPFLTPYILRDLKFSYAQFMTASATAVLAQFLTLNSWGRLADRFGNRQVLKVTGLLLPTIPPLWLLTTNFYAILAIQLFAGFAWAGFSLAMGNSVLDLVSPPKRARCAAIYNSANAIGIFLGASLGGLLARWAPSELHFAGVHVSLVSNLLVLFLVSALFRLLVSLALLPSVREVRDVPPLAAREFFVQIAQARPLTGFKFDLFIPGRRRRTRKISGAKRAAAVEAERKSDRKTDAAVGR
jgi:MFS family permease